MVKDRPFFVDDECVSVSCGLMTMPTFRVPYREIQVIGVERGSRACLFIGLLRAHHVRRRRSLHARANLLRAAHTRQSAAPIMPHCSFALSAETL